MGVGYSAGEFSCCPIPVGLGWLDEKSAVTMAARNICVAEKENKNIMSLCNGCFQSLVVSDYKPKHDPILKKEVNEVLAEVGKQYQGSIDIKHFVRVLYEDVGIEKIKAAVTRPLTGLKVALHPGCHYMRPSHIINFDDPLEPKVLRQLVEAIGATPVTYGQEVICCGNSVRNTDPKIANSFLKSKIDGAISAGAECLVVICLACFQQFEVEQTTVNKTLPEGSTPYKYPVYYITELMALAMGKSPEEVGISNHRNKGLEVLEKIGVK